MQALKNFSFKEAIENRCPLNDIQKSKHDLLQEIDVLLESDDIQDSTKASYRVNKPILEKSIDSLFILFQSPNLDVEEELANSIIDSLDAMKNTWVDASEKNVLKVFNGYNLYPEAIPTAIRFYKHLIRTKFITNKKVTRTTLEEEYILFVRNVDYRFSCVLFALSWLQLLNVYNKEQIYFTQRPLLSF